MVNKYFHMGIQNFNKKRSIMKKLRTKLNGSLMMVVLAMAVVFISGQVYGVTISSGTLYITLLDSETYDPITNAYVTVDGTQIAHKGGGTYSSSFPSYSDYTVIATAPGYTTQSKSVYLETFVSDSFLMVAKDTDEDGIKDPDEMYTYGTDHELADTDGDGINDGDELANWGDDWNADPDEDGDINILDADSDNDGLDDGEEWSTYDTDPADNDSDNDQYSDGQEVEAGSDPADPDSIPAKLLIDYGPHGLYEYDGVNNVQIGTWDPEGLEYWSDLDKAVMDYGTHGPHTYDGSSWDDLGSLDAEQLEPVGNTLFADFGGHGLYAYEGTIWFQIDTRNPEAIEAWGSLLAIDYGSEGLYTYDGTTLNQIQTWDPEGLEAYGDELIADFGTSHGLYTYDGTTWTELDSGDPKGLEAWNGLVAIDLGAEGLYTYDGTTFEQVRAWELEGFKAWDDKLVIDYGTAHGVWFYDGTSFTDPSPGGDWDPIAFGPFGAKLAVDFGTNTGSSSNGIYIYSDYDETWEHLGIWSPDTDGFLKIPYNF